MENDMKFGLVIGVVCVFGMMGCSNDNGTNAEPESELLAATEVKATRIGRNAVRSTTVHSVLTGEDIRKNKKDMDE